MKSYYIFVCLDSVPIIELLVNSKYKAIKKFEKIDWQQTKYIILDFKSSEKINDQIIEKGCVKYQQKILTKQILYIKINLKKAHETISKNKKSQWKPKEWNLLYFAEKVFFGEPLEFIEYLKKTKIFKEKDIIKFEASLKNLQKEKEFLESWNKVINTKK